MFFSSDRFTYACTVPVWKTSRRTHTHIGLLPWLIALLEKIIETLQKLTMSTKLLILVNFQGISHSLAAAPKMSKAWKRLCCCASSVRLLASGKTVYSLFADLRAIAWAVAFVEGIRSYSSWSRLKLFDNKFCHCFNSSCNCICNFFWSWYLVPTVWHVTVRPVLTGTVWEAGTVQARVTALFFIWMICFNMFLFCHYLMLQHIIRWPALSPPCPL